MTPTQLFDSEGNEIKNPENFMKWFSGSVAVDSDGRPKVFYHASYEDFDEFMFPWERDEDNYESEGYDGGNLGIGFYFTDDMKYSKRFGTPKKFYLKITHLLVATEPDVAEEINRRANDPDEELMYGSYGEVIDRICQEEHYDGVAGESVGGLSYGASEIMVKSASQIKSVNNNGAWSCDTNNLFEGVDYVGKARTFANELISVLLSLSEDEIAGSFVGMNEKYKAPEFSIPNTSDKIPTGIPLHIVLRPQHRMYVGVMDTSIDPPALVLFAGDRPQTTTECAKIIINELNNNPQLYNHELVHLYDRNTFDLPNYRRPSKRSVAAHANELKTKNPDVGEVDTEMLRYLNSPTEINARLVSAIDDAITNGQIKSFDEFKDAVLNNEQIKVGALTHNNPTKFTKDNYAKILKLIYKVYQNITEI